MKRLAIDRVGLSLGLAMTGCASGRPPRVRRKDARPGDRPAAQSSCSSTPNESQNIDPDSVALQGCDHGRGIALFRLPIRMKEVR